MPGIGPAPVSQDPASSWRGGNRPLTLGLSVCASGQESVRAARRVGALAAADGRWNRTRVRAGASQGRAAQTLRVGPGSGIFYLEGARAAGYQVRPPGVGGAARAQSAGCGPAWMVRLE